MIDEYEIRRSVLQSCIPVSATNSRRDFAKRTKQVVQAHAYCDRFFQSMHSKAPFDSEEAAIQSLAPIAVWFIGWAARQFAFLVIRALWREWNRQKTGAFCGSFRPTWPRCGFAVAEIGRIW
jgi:hypothetical protein